MGTLTPLFSLVHDFLLVSLPDEQKCSPNTIRSYRKSLELLFDFIKTKRDISLSEITFEMIDRNAVSEFLDYLETERNCSISTRNHRLHCIRAFYKYDEVSSGHTHWALDERNHWRDFSRQKRNRTHQR